jgi:DNA-binding response OmpR family regulator
MTKTLQQKQTEAKGFALYVGLSDSDAQAAGISLTEIAIQLRQRLAELVPGIESDTYAALAIGPKESIGSNLQLTRIALGEPRAVQKQTPEAEEETAAKGVVVDLNRRRLYADGRLAPLTCKEFELLAYLIENQGRTVSRNEIASISERCGEPTPNPRTIDVHVRRLRSKIAGYEDIVRTARGKGYRFDKHPDVLIEL